MEENSDINLATNTFRNKLKLLHQKTERENSTQLEKAENKRLKNYGVMEFQISIIRDFSLRCRSLYCCILGFLCFGLLQFWDYEC